MLLQNTGYCNLPLSNLCTVSPVQKLNAQILRPFILYINSFQIINVGERNPFTEGMLLNPPLAAQVPIHEFFLPTNVDQQVPPIRGSASHFIAQVLLHCSEIVCNRPQTLSVNSTCLLLQPFKQRLAAPGPLAPGVPTHSTDLPNLQKVITIRPVPLQQRLPSSTIPAMGPSTSKSAAILIIIVTLFFQGLNFCVFEF